MNTTIDLIDAIIDGNTIDIQNSFNAAMAEKLSSELGHYKASLASSMFTNEVTDGDTEDDGD